MAGKVKRALWLYGRKPVLERIKASPDSIKGLYLQKRTDLSEIVREAKSAGVDFESVDKAWIKSRCGEGHAQGVVARVNAFEYASFDAVIRACSRNEITPVLLDGVTDPQNLGSVIRNLACLGGFALVLPEYGAVHVNETVLRVASGGENYLPIAKVKKIPRGLKKLKDKGVWMIGAVAGEGEDLVEAELRYPMAVVMGAEGRGIGPSTRKLLDAAFFLPMRGAAISYNVGVATALFCYEISRKKREGAGQKTG